jgi:hypothetical protein
VFQNSLHPPRGFHVSATQAGSVDQLELLPEPSHFVCAELPGTGVRGQRTDEGTCAANGVHQPFVASARGVGGRYQQNEQPAKDAARAQVGHHVDALPTDTI